MMPVLIYDVDLGTNTQCFFTIVTIVTSFVWIQKRHCGSVNIEKLPIPIELMINIIGHYCL